MSAPQSAPLAPRLTTSTPSRPRSAAAARSRARGSAYSAGDTPPGRRVCSVAACTDAPWFVVVPSGGRRGSARALDLLGLLVPALAVPDLGPQSPAPALGHGLHRLGERVDPSPQGL